VIQEKYENRVNNQLQNIEYLQKVLKFRAVRPNITIYQIMLFHVELTNKIPCQPYCTWQSIIFFDFWKQSHCVPMTTSFKK